VFLVEDETFTRDGIREKVDWQSVGFEYSGEAADGEMALPLIEATQPDVIITDIKMPFMDGLQLSKIIREYMPWVKIIIISGHDEFEYARAALKLGVTEYLLKPITSVDLISVLQRVAVTLDQERSEREELKKLQKQVEGNLLLRRAQFLLRLVMGGISSAEALEQGQQLGLSLVAQNYLVILIKIELCDDGKPFDYQEYQRIEQIAANLADNNPDIYLTKKDPEELVLIIKGDDAEELRQEAIFWRELILQEGARDSVCRLLIEIGSPQQRLSDLHHSFAEAMVRLKNTGTGSLVSSPVQVREAIKQLQSEHVEFEKYLKFGSLSDFNAFFDMHLLPVCETALQSRPVMHYIFLDVILTIAQFVSDLGDQGSQVAPEIQDLEHLLQNITTIEQMKGELRRIISGAMIFRNNQTNHERSMLIQQAKHYIDDNFHDPDLQMNKVAAQFNLSANHFSTIFSQELGETFRDYLNNLRIDRAKELLSTTSIMCSQVAYQCGYKDPHYFSTFFKKKTGFTPQGFREHAQQN
jgi:two-component system response regulator YesN